MSSIRTVLLFIRGVRRNRTEPPAENLALRQQLAVLTERKRRPRPRTHDRTYPWTITRRSNEKSNHRNAERLSRFRRSAGFTIDTAARPVHIRTLVV